MADLNSPLFWPDVFHILLLYLECTICFLVAYQYFILPGTKRARPRPVNDSSFPEQTLFFFIVGLFFLFLLAHFSVFGDLSRRERYLMVRESSFHKLFSASSVLIYALGLLFILRCKDRRLSFTLAVLIVLWSFVSGGRMWGVTYLLFFLYRYQIKMSRKAILIGAVLFIFVNFAWKPTTYHYWETGELSLQFDPDSEFAFSRFEGIQAWVNAVEVLHDQDCPYWSGWSYTILPLRLAAPRFLSENPPQTLSESQAEYLCPDFSDSGGGIGFSAISEAWLNFGVLGPGILGLIWGIAAKFMDKHRNHLASIVFFILTLRLFRTDFGSLFKSWILMFGIALILSHLLFLLVESMTKHQAKGTLGPTEATPAPFPSGRRSSSPSQV